MAADGVELVELALPSGVACIPDKVTTSERLQRQFFSRRTWDEDISEDEKRHLIKFLPVDSQGDEQSALKAAESCLESLFSGENFHFGNPLTHFLEQVRSGNWSYQKVAERQIVREIQWEDYKHRQQERQYVLLQEMLKSRKKLLESNRAEPVRTPLSVLKLEQKSIKTRADLEHRTGKRYLEEIKKLRSALGEEEGNSQDELFPNGPPSKRNAKREINLLESDYWKSFNDKPPSAPNVANTKPKAASQPESLLLRNRNKPSPASTAPVPMVTEPTPPTPPSSADTKPPRPPGQQSLLIPKASCPPVQLTPKKGIDDVDVVEEAVANIPGMSPPPGLEEMAAAEIPLELEPGQSSIPMVLPPDMYASSADLGESLLSAKEAPELKKEDEAHVMDAAPMQMLSEAVTFGDAPEIQSKGDLPPSFFVLLRNEFCAQPEDKISIPTLEKIVQRFQDENKARVDWLASVSVWREEIPSALAFLIGAFPDAQPDSFEPLVTADSVLGMYQWIGKGRDSDFNLNELSKWWFDRRSDCRAMTTTTNAEESPVKGDQNSSLNQPPGVIKPPVSQTESEFHEQEFQRFSKPLNAFTYRIGGSEYMVPPVRATGWGGLAGLSPKAKAHPLLLQDRPPCINVVTLVRDAVARLPNGAGTRSDIVRLVRESQYLNPATSVEGSSLTTAVSGALDRLQGESDPCVKYGGTRKIWHYLHRERTLEDHMKAFRDQQASSKSAYKPRKKTNVTSNDQQTGIGPGPSLLKSTPALPQDILADVKLQTTISQEVRKVIPPATAAASLGQSVSTVTAATSPVATQVRYMNPQQLAIESPQKQDLMQIAQQTIQLMTPQGLRSFKVTPATSSSPTPSGTNAMLSSSPITKSRVVPNLPSKPVPVSSSRKVAVSVVAPPKPAQLAAASSSSVLSTVPSSGGSRDVGPTLSLPQTPLPSSSLAQSPVAVNQTVVSSQSQTLTRTASQPQRVVVRNAEGKQLQLTVEQLQKLIASGQVKQQPSATRVKQTVRLASPAEATTQSSINQSSTRTTSSPNIVRITAPGLPSSDMNSVRLLQNFSNSPPTAPTSAASVLRVNRQQIRITSTPSVRPSAPGPPQIPAQSPSQPVQIRLSSNVAPGQKVSLGSKEYVVGVTPAGQQVLTPISQPQPRPQQVIVQGKPIMVGAGGQQQIHSVRIVQQPSRKQ